MNDYKFQNKNIDRKYFYIDTRSTHCLSQVTSVEGIRTNDNKKNVLVF